MLFLSNIWGALQKGWAFDVSMEGEKDERNKTYR